MPWSRPCWTSAVAAGGRRPSRSPSATAATRWFRRPPVGSGDDSQGAPGDCPRRGADGPSDALAGRPRIQQDQPGIQAALQALVDPLTRGDPTSPLRWTCKSRAKLAAALTEVRVSSTTGLHRGPGCGPGNAQCPRREHLCSVDTKKKELVGNFKNGGREWQPKGTPPAVLVHDFPTDAEGKAIPYGVYDMARNEAWVSVGWDHDTPAFAVASIRTGGIRWVAAPTPRPRPCSSRRCGREQRVSVARLEA